MHAANFFRGQSSSWYVENSLISKNNLVPGSQILPPVFPVAKKNLWSGGIRNRNYKLTKRQWSAEKALYHHFPSAKNNFRSLTFVSKGRYQSHASKPIHTETSRNLSTYWVFQVLVSPGLFSQFSFYPSAGKSFSKASLND